MVRGTEVELDDVKKLEKIVSIECREYATPRLKKDNWDACFFEDEKGKVIRIRDVNSVFTGIHRIDRLIADDDLFFIRLFSPQSVDVHVKKGSRTVTDISERQIKSAITRGKTPLRKKIAKRVKFHRYFIEEGEPFRKEGEYFS